MKSLQSDLSKITPKLRVFSTIVYLCTTHLYTVCCTLALLEMMAYSHVGLQLTFIFALTDHLVCELSERGKGSHHISLELSVTSPLSFFCPCSNLKTLRAIK